MQADGSFRHAETSVTDLLGDPAVEALGAQHPRRDRARRLEDELRERALSDELTGLPNRVLFLERTRHALVRPRRPAARRLLPRPRRLQGRQRRARPRRRRPAAAEHRLPAHGGGAARRHGGPLRWRRVRHPAGGHGSRRRCHRGGAAARARSGCRSTSATQRPSSTPASGSRSPPSGTATPTSCSPRPTPRCTPPRRAGATATRSSARRCGSRRSPGPGCGWTSTSRSCRTSSGCTTSRSSTCRPVSGWVSRRSSGGCIPSAAC